MTGIFVGLAVGDDVPELVRTIELADMIAYAGATWDWHRMHYDPEFVAGAQLPGAVVDGQVFGALLAEAVQDWLGPQAVLRTLNFRFANLAFAGETFRCSGEVTAVDDDSVNLALRVDILGDRARPAVVPASATVVARP
jgi:acyl dehydratase